MPHVIDDKRQTMHFYVPGKAVLMKIIYKEHNLK